MSLLILLIDDEPDVETLFRQQFRRDLRSGRFTMEFAQSAPVALQRITDAAGVSLILILSDINMPGMSGLDLLPEAIVGSSGATCWPSSRNCRRAWLVSKPAPHRITGRANSKRLVTLFA